MRASVAFLLPLGLAAATHLDLAKIRAEIKEKADAVIANTVPKVVPLFNFLALTRSGEVLYQATAGTRQYGSTVPLNFHDFFWLASHTKILGMMSLMKCVDYGLIRLDDSVLGLLPDLAKEQVRMKPNDPKSPTRSRVGDITVRNLLTFTGGNAYPVVDFLATLSPATIVTDPAPFFPNNRSVYEGAHAADPNCVWRYGAEADYAGLLVEKLTGRSLGDFIQRHLLTPAGVSPEEFSFRPNKEQTARLVGQHVRVDAKTIVPRGPIYNTTNIQFESAGAGGFGTISALAEALLPFVNNGRHPKTGAQILSPEMTKEALSPQLSQAELVNGLNQPTQAANDGGLFFPGTEKQWGLGAMLFPAGFDTGRGNGTFAWAGFSNTNWHTDNEKGVVMLGWSSFIAQDDPIFNAQVRYPIEKIIYDIIGEGF
ncbi:carboxylate methylbutanoyltransferase-like protein [Cladobotryum mycophilum]|uniref:Carboxylate methylbutanoyltransferase-like protein n=1 Tax=Cladobotryum mycophilum TaxID=491253 RepID=A0ABR0SL76_9HYPO